MKNKYTIPKLNKSSKYWYVHYRYDGIQFRETNGYNKIEDLKLRETKYNELCRSILIELQNDWNPNIKDGMQLHSDMYFIEALRFALEQKKSDIEKTTYSSYKGTIKFIETASLNLKMERIKISDIKRSHIRLLMNEAKVNRKWTNNAYNANLLHLKILLYVLIKYDIIEFNPATRIDNKKVNTESNFHNPASDIDIEKIKEALINTDYNFYIFCITVFHTGIRPAELLRVTLGMVNLTNDEFNLSDTITKNGKARNVPINKHLKEYYLKMNFSKIQKDYYLFGSLKSPGRGKKKKENKLLPDFVPSQLPTQRRTAWLRWISIIEGLNIKMNLYALKHYGANKKILAGMNMDSLRELYGHSSKLMTEKYAKIIKEVYRKDIMDNSPDF
jgi:integrase